MDYSLFYQKNTTSRALVKDCLGAELFHTPSGAPQAEGCAISLSGTAGITFLAAAREGKILTINAFERTAGKKDGAAAARAAERRLLPNVPARPADKNFGGHTARAESVFSVRAASAGAKSAIHLTVFSSRSASIISYATCPSSSAIASPRFAALRCGSEWLYCLILQ